MYAWVFMYVCGDDTNSYVELGWKSTETKKKEVVGEQEKEKDEVSFSFCIHISTHTYIHTSRDAGRI